MLVVTGALRVTESPTESPAAQSAAKVTESPSHPFSMPSLDRLAREALLANGFVPDAGEAVVREVGRLADAPTKGDQVRDLRTLAWSSIDNASSRDLDQIEVAEELSDGAIVLRIGIADVDALVPKGSAMDAHAAANA